MSKNTSKQKGNRFERLVVNIAKEKDIEAIRAWGSNGKSLGMHEEVDCLIGGQKVQCKCRKRIASWIKVPDECDVTMVKEDRGEVYVITRYNDWLKERSLLS